MKISTKTFFVTIVALGLIVVGCSKKPTPLDQSPVSGQLKHFIAEKKAQANAAATAEGKEMLPEFQTIFAAADKGDWETISNTFDDLRRLAARPDPQKVTLTAPSASWISRILADLRRRISKGRRNDAKLARLNGTQWEDVKEVWGMFNCLASDVAMDKYSVDLGQEIVGSIPAGSIYFGGSDPGRWTVTALQTSQVKGDPFFTLTQNAMADPTYLDYLRSMYGGKIYIPTADDSQKCFQDYVADAQRRILHDQNSPSEAKQIKAGEDVHVDTSGHVQVSGQIAVMDINARLAKIIFDRETNREFYVEESFPLDWMYPHLEPHGLVMEINRTPMAELPEDVIRKDHEFWARRLTPVIGDWLKEDTSVQEICAFAERIYLKHDFTGFKGDPRIVSDDWPGWMSRLRSAIGGIYAWRLGIATSGGTVPAESLAKGDARGRMIKEADFAYRQAFALSPHAPEAVYRYVNFLLNQKRIADALAVAETAMKLHAGKADGTQFRYLVDNVKNIRAQESAKRPGN